MRFQPAVTNLVERVNFIDPTAGRTSSIAFFTCYSSIDNECVRLIMARVSVTFSFARDENFLNEYCTINVAVSVANLQSGNIT